MWGKQPRQEAQWTSASASSAWLAFSTVSRSLYCHQPSLPLPSTPPALMGIGIHFPQVYVCCGCDVFPVIHMRFEHKKQQQQQQKLETRTCSYSWALAVKVYVSHVGVSWSPSEPQVHTIIPPWCTYSQQGWSWLDRGRLWGRECGSRGKA